jgi:hypothetical protein
MKKHIVTQGSNKENEAYHALENRFDSFGLVFIIP